MFDGRPGKWYSVFMKASNPSTDSLLQTLYIELRQIAQRQLSRERISHTLQATALVNEAYLRLKPDRLDEGWKSKSQFLRAASEAMRRILVDHARAKLAVKRGGRLSEQEFREVPIELPLPADKLLAIHECLDKLAAEDSVKAELVKLRVFAGMSQKEASFALGLTKSTADRHWAYAKVRLMSMMQT